MVQRVNFSLRHMTTFLALFFRSGQFLIGCGFGMVMSYGVSVRMGLVAEPLLFILGIILMTTGGWLYRRPQNAAQEEMAGQK